MSATTCARLALSLFCAGLVACSSAPARPPTNRAAAAIAPPPPSCARPVPMALRLEPLSRQSSSVALARANHELLAYVANGRGRRIDVVDVATRARLGSIPVSGTPDELLALGDGRLIATLSDRNALETIAIGEGGLRLAGSERCVVDAPRGPHALAVTEEADQLVLTSTLADTLSILDARSLARVGGSTLRRAPESVVVEGDRAFVSHLVGDSLSVVDLAGGGTRDIDLRLTAATASAAPEALGSRRTGAQGYALASFTVPSTSGAGEGTGVLRERAPRRRIVAPHVSVDVGDQTRFGVYYGPPPSRGIPKEAPVAVTVDGETERPRSSHVLALSPDGFARECLLPRAAAFRPGTRRLYVACRGIDELLELDGDAADPMRVVLGRYDLSKGVSGLAIADEEGLGVAFGEFDEALDVIDLATGARARVDLAAHDATKLSKSYQRGRELFYETRDPRISFDGVACASCHPDGGDDGLTWSTPDGPRQTPMLAGRVHGTAPYGWTRNVGTLPDYIESTIGRLGGTGLPADDLVAIASYLERMPIPAGSTHDDVSRGAALFAAQGCSDCHRDVLGTDHQSHEVSADKSPYDTPTLQYVGLTAPYFHDGRYRSLDELLADPASRMGATSKLSADDRAALSRFLETL